MVVEIEYWFLREFHDLVGVKSSIFAADLLIERQWAVVCVEGQGQSSDKNESQISQTKAEVAPKHPLSSASTNQILEVILKTGSRKECSYDYELWFFVDEAK